MTSRWIRRLSAAGFCVSSLTPMGCALTQPSTTAQVAPGAAAPTVRSAPASTPVTAADVQKQFSSTMETLKGYAYSRKEEYVAAANRQIDDYNRQIASMRAEAARQADQKRAEMEKAAADLEAKKNAAVDALNHARNSSAAAWQDVQGGVSTAMAELKQGADQAKARFQPPTTAR